MNETTAENGRRPRRGHGRPTLHDVAAVAQVTRITVSRYLREPHLVAPDTAERIQAAIAQTGYVRNLQAGQLASGRSRMVAALIPNVGHSIFGESIQGLVDGLHDTEYELLLMPTGYSLEREEAQLRALAGWGPAALVITGRHHTPGALRLLRDAQQAGTPVVEIWDCSHAAPAADGAPALPQIGDDNLDLQNRWREPETAVPVEPRSGPVVITIEYRIPVGSVVPFLSAMSERRRIRKRDGAHGWSLMRDLGDPELWVERYHVSTWLD